MPLDNILHYPVMLNEIQNIIKNPKIIIDATFGGGGYSNAFLKKFSNCNIKAFDRDEEVKNIAQELTNTYKSRFSFYHNKFSNIKDHIGNDLENITHVIYDLGLSNFQIQNREKGFSYKINVPLKMTMGINNYNALDILNNQTEKNLSNIISLFGEDKDAKRIAKNIIKYRNQKKIINSEDLKYIILKSKRKYQKKDPFAQTFQAIRIVVNKELNEIYYSLKFLMENSVVGTTFIIITFHSLEDRLVKNIFNFYGKSLNYSRYLPSINKINTFKIITKKPIKPSNKEIVINPNSRSAKLRVIKKINNERVSISINNTGMEKYLTLESQINE